MASDVNKPSKKKEPSEFQQEYFCDSCQLCTSDPFWKNLKFEQVDILKVFLEANRGKDLFSKEKTSSVSSSSFYCYHFL